MDTGLNVTRYESEPTFDGSFFAREFEEPSVRGKANDDNLLFGASSAYFFEQEGFMRVLQRLFEGHFEQLGLIKAFERLEPRDGKLSCVVLRGTGAGNSSGLPVLHKF